MKKNTRLFLGMILAFIAFGCDSGKPAGYASGQSAGVNDVLAEGMAKEDQKKEERSAESAAESETEAADSKPGKDKKDSAETSEEKAEEPAIPENIDVDLTLLSSTMVFSEVSNIISNPPDYAGKTIKMRGIYNCYEDPNTGNHYCACVIPDATACCAQGIEFVLSDRYSYPEDYPTVNDPVCVVGVFDLYEENGVFYCTLRDVELV